MYNHKKKDRSVRNNKKILKDLLCQIAELFRISIRKPPILTSTLPYNSQIEINN